MRKKNPPKKKICKSLLRTLGQQQKRIITFIVYKDPTFPSILCKKRNSVATLHHYFFILDSLKDFDKLVRKGKAFSLLLCGPVIMITGSKDVKMAF